jgi:galacturonosyltransferase
VEKILSLDESSRRDMGACGRGFIERSFDRNIIIGKYKDLLNRIKD